MSVAPFTLAYRVDAGHCDEAAVIADALATVDLAGLRAVHDRPAGPGATSPWRELATTVRTCPPDSLSAALDHLRRAATRMGGTGTLGPALTLLAQHQGRTCACAGQAWQRWTADADTRLTAIDDQDGISGMWAATALHEERSMSGVYFLLLHSILNAFQHANLDQPAASLSLSWDGTVLRARYRAQLTDKETPGRFQPLSDDRCDLASEFDWDDPSNLPSAHRAAATPAHLVPVAAALVRAHENATTPRPWRSTPDLLNQLTALHDEVTPQGWDTITAIAGRRWPGTIADLRAAALGLLTPAALHPGRPA